MRARAARRDRCASSAGNAENAKSEFELAEIVGAVGNAYVRRGLSPPSQLQNAAKHWLDRTSGEEGQANSARVRNLNQTLFAPAYTVQPYPRSTPAPTMATNRHVQPMLWFP
jgi:hypothetical protein